MLTVRGARRIGQNRHMRIESGVSLRECNTFGLPAQARRLVRVRSEADVRAIVDHPELGRAPKFILGGGSNIVLTRDVADLVVKVELRGMQQCINLKHQNLVSRAVHALNRKMVERMRHAADFACSSGDALVYREGRAEAPLRPPDACRSERQIAMMAE